MSGPLQLGLQPLKTAYLAVLLFSMLAMLAMNYWVQTRAATSRIQHAVVHHNASILWALAAAVGLVVESQQLALPLVYVRTGLSYAVVILFVRFATLYSGRSTSLRQPFNAAFLAGMGIGLVGLVTQPWLGLHFEPLAFHTDPFPYYETGFGPAWQFSLLVSYIGIGVALYYLLELFVTSQHRSSRPVAVYAVGVGLSLVPSVLTATGQVPTLPGYDHSVFGLGSASIAFFLGAWLGMVKITPISRDRLLATTEDGLIVVDDDGEIADYNAVARRFFTTGAPIGHSLADIAPSVADALPAAGLDDAAERTTERHAIELTHTADGEKRVYSMDISSVTDMDTVHGYALVLREVTERHANRAELRRQNDQLDDFANSISHHLRNPLQVASGQTEMARRELADGPPGALDRVDDLEQSLERMETIITDLRTLAKQGKSVESTAFVSFGDVVEEAGAHVETGDWTLTVERDGTIRADQGRLLSILENLVRNSVEHAGPAVDMSVELTDDGFVFCDDGPGIDAERDRLFEYGYTTSSEGTGLGLSIVKTMAESHGWDVRVDTDHDGARFVVTGVVTDAEPPTARQ